MPVFTTYSNNPNVQSAIEEIACAFKENNFKPKLILYFFSAEYSEKNLAKLIYEKMECDSIGCSTAATYYGTKFWQKSIVVMGFSDNMFANYFLKTISIRSKDVPFKSLTDEISAYFNQPFETFEPDKYFGLLLDDFHSRNQNYFINNLSKYSPVTFIGGSSSDQSSFAQHYVHHNGNTYANSVMLGVLKSNYEFKFIKMYSHIPKDTVLIPTDVDTDGRTILEINGKNPVKAFTDALDISREEYLSNIWKYPLGVKNANGSFSVFATNKAFENGTLLFFADIIQGNEYYLMKYSDIIRDSRRKIKHLQNDLAGKNILGLIQFNCLGRHFFLLEENKIDNYLQMFGFCPHIALLSNAEYYNDYNNYISSSIVFYK